MVPTKMEVKKSVEALDLHYIRFLEPNTEHVMQWNAQLHVQFQLC